jgi:hypothetical protein
MISIAILTLTSTLAIGPQAFEFQSQGVPYQEMLGVLI